MANVVDTLGDVGERRMSLSRTSDYFVIILQVHEIDNGRHVRKRSGKGRREKKGNEERTGARDAARRVSAGERFLPAYFLFQYLMLFPKGTQPIQIRMNERRKNREKKKERKRGEESCAVVDGCRRASDDDE